MFVLYAIRSTLLAIRGSVRNMQYDVRSTKDYVRNYKKNMQNKAKFRKSQMNVNNVLTKDYEKKDTWSRGKKQSQTNPNSKRPK